jgi:hypothetical protein
MTIPQIFTDISVFSHRDEHGKTAGQQSWGLEGFGVGICCLFSNYEGNVQDLANKGL